MCFAPQRRALFRHLKFQYILTSKCASRRNDMHFFDISTSKSGPDLVCFVHFVFEMCFAPQRRALFRHLNFQKWSDHGVFCTFWLENVLRATMACIFSSVICPAGSAPATLASLLFDPGATNHWKTQCFATFLPFRAPGSSFFCDFLFLLLFSSLTLPTSTFPSVHTVGSLTSKLPSIRTVYRTLPCLPPIFDRLSPWTRLSLLILLEGSSLPATNWILWAPSC